VSGVYVSAVIVAGGGGSRMGGPVKKQFLSLGGRPVVAYAIEAFERCPAVSEIILVLPADGFERARDFCRADIIEACAFKKVRQIAAGGRTRQESVLNGLRAADPAADIVMTHDAARPFVSAAVIEAAAAAAFETGACAAGVPVRDTIKICGADDVIISTPARETLWAAQTPQAFRRETLTDAYRRAGKPLSAYPDDASMVEELGVKVRMIMGGYENIKLTAPEDVVMAEALLKSYNKRYYQRL